MSEQKNITLSGAGLVGSLLAIFLGKRGHKVNVYERRPDMRKTDVFAGRSINLALSDRGWKALEKTGIADEIKKIAIPMYGRFIHHADSTTAYQPYGKEGQAIYSVSRGELNCRLMDLAEKQENVKINFNQRCANVDMRSGDVTIENPETGFTSKFNSDIIFGSDGAFAQTRLAFQLTTDRFDYSQTYMEAGYKELTIPANADGSFKIEKNALHIWPRGHYMMIALPNMDGSFTCTLFFPHEGNPSFESVKTNQEVKEFFEKIFPDAVPLMPTLLEDYQKNPVSSLCIVRCKPWVFEDKLALIGDAAHAIVPFYGQGMNCGFEDVLVLDKLIDKHKGDWKNTFTEYQALRKPDADAIADLALANFIEMRDLVGDPKFLLRKKIEANYYSKHPDKWVPLYTMVTFSPEIRYSEAIARGKQQDLVMEKVMTLPGIETKWDSKEIEELISSLISW